MSYVRRGTTKHVMNVRSGPPPTPKPNKMHRNVDTSVRCTEIADIGLRSARARPGGGAGHPGEYFRGRRAPPRAPTARASAGGAARQLRTRTAANQRPGHATYTARAVTVAAAPRGHLGVTGHPGRPLSALY